MSAIKNQSAAQHHGVGSSCGFPGNQSGIGSEANAELFNVSDRDVGGGHSLDFSGLIAETEASMRGKLSQLTMPDTLNTSNEDIEQTMSCEETKQHPSIEETKQAAPAGMNEKCPPSMTQDDIIVMSVESNQTKADLMMSLTNTVSEAMPVQSKPSETADLTNQNAGMVNSSAANGSQTMTATFSLTGPNVMNMANVNSMGGQQTLPGIPGTNYLQDGVLQNRNVIWKGNLEWQDENTPGPADRITRSLACMVSIGKSEPDLCASGWPSGLTMQVMPKDLLNSPLLQSLVKNSRMVEFHFDPDDLQNLHKVMSDDFSGCIHLPQCKANDIQVILLLFSKGLESFVGLIPGDQSGLVHGLRQVIAQTKLAVTKSSKKSNDFKDVSHNPEENSRMTQCDTEQSQEAESLTFTEDHQSNAPCPKQMKSSMSNFVTIIENPAAVAEVDNKKAKDVEKTAKLNTNASESKLESSGKSDGEEEMEFEIDGKAANANVDKVDANIGKDNLENNEGDGTKETDLKQNSATIVDLTCVDNDASVLSPGSGKLVINVDSTETESPTVVHKINSPSPKAGLLTKIKTSLEILKSVYKNVSKDLDSNREQSSSEHTGNESLILECEHVIDKVMVNEMETDVETIVDQPIESPCSSFKDMEQTDLSYKASTKSCNTVNANIKANHMLEAVENNIDETDISKTDDDKVEDTTLDMESSLVITNVISLADIEDENIEDIETSDTAAHLNTFKETAKTSAETCEVLDTGKSQTQEHANEDELSQESSKRMEINEPGNTVAANEKQNPTQSSPKLPIVENSTTLSQLPSQTKSIVQTEQSSASTTLSTATFPAIPPMSSLGPGVQNVPSTSQTAPVPSAALTAGATRQVQLTIPLNILQRPVAPVTVKSEPADDGSYSIEQSITKSVGNRPLDVMNQVTNTCYSVTGQNSEPLYSGVVSRVLKPTIRKEKVTIHSARKLFTNAVSNSTKDIQKLMMTKVSPPVPVAKQIVAAAQSFGPKMVTLLPGKTNPQPVSAASRPIMPKPNNSPGSSTKPSGASEASTNNTEAPVDRMQTINIHSVGVAKITELIARKNPIQPYKAHLNEKYGTSINYVCHECGDVFKLEKSLEIHKGRCSMKLRYHCENCKSGLLFTNKCQFLSHLRSHMNIAKTQAVPIHIKSDSIEITSYYHEIKPGQDFEWYKLEPKYLCPFCLCSGTDHVAFQTQEQLAAHFKNPTNNNKREMGCSRCSFSTYSDCGLRAHVDIHMFLEENQLGMLLTKLICPKCAKSFSPESPNVPLNERSSIREEFSSHINACYLPSVMKDTFRCPECVTGSIIMDENTALRHLCIKLEKYFKCQLCPMALKTLRNFDYHAKNEHQGCAKTKLIFRCHICATVIDDCKYLVSHLQSHLKEMQIDKNGIFGNYCAICGLKDISKEEAVKHLQIHQESTQSQIKFCKFCGQLCSTQRSLLRHVLVYHMKRTTSKTVDLVNFLCTKCGFFQPKQDHECFRASKMVTESSESTPIMNASTPIQNCSTPIKNGSTPIINGSAINVEKSSNDFQPIVCRLCKACFLNGQSMKKHIMTVHQDNLFCLHCPKMNFSNFGEYRSHEIVCKAVKNSTCVEPLVQQKLPKESMSAKKRRNDDEAMIDEEMEIKLTPAVSKRPLVNETETLYPCDKCTLKFSRKSKLDEHINSDHGIHPCHLCGKMYGSTRAVKRHLMMDHEGKRLQYPCLICRRKKIEKSFAIKSMLFKHLRAKHKVKEIDESKAIAELPGLPDVACDKLEDREEGYTSPESTPEPPIKKLRVDGENDFKCAKCLFSSEDKGVFQKHIEDHKTPNTFQCLNCGLCFSVLPSLEKHLFMVHKVRNFQKYMKENQIENPADLVDVDDEIEREPARMDVEEESESDIEEKNPLECRVCYRVFENEAQLRGHMRVHGMAFIKRSRRRSQGPSIVKKRAESEDRNCERIGENLVLKITKKINAVVEKSGSDSGKERLGVNGEETEHTDV